MSRPADLNLELPARPESVRVLRERLGFWLDSVGTDPEDCYDLVAAAAELVANAVEHPRRPTPPPMVTITAHLNRSDVVIVVSDHGQWKDGPRSPNRGRGLVIIDALVDDRATECHAVGTTVTIRKRLARRSAMTDTVTIKVIGNAHVATVRAEIDLTTADGIAHEMMTAATDAKLMIIDLSGVTYVDSAGVRLLFQLNRDLAARDTEVRVVVPRGSHVQRILDVVELDQAVPVHESVTHALTGVNKTTTP